MPRRDALGTIDEPPAFAALSPQRGQPAEAPWRLALITVMPFAAALADRTAAEAVRSRIDWKAALSFDHTAPGFHSAVLAKFRQRLVAGQAAQVLRDALLACLQACGLLKAGGRDRTDSPPVRAAVRACTRLAPAADAR